MSGTGSTEDEMEGFPEMKRTEVPLGFIYPVDEDGLADLLGGETVSSQEVTCEWTVPFSMAEFYNPLEEGIKWISSPVFHLGDKINRPTQWRVQIGYHTNDTDQTLAIYLWRLDPMNPKTSEVVENNWTGTASVHYRFDILATDGTVAFTKENGRRNMEIGECYGWRKFVTYSYIEGRFLPYVPHRVKLKVFLKIQKIDQKEEDENVSERQTETETCITWGPDNPIIDIYNSKGFVTNCPRNILYRSSKFHSMVEKKERKEMPLIQLVLGSYTDAHLIRELVEFIKKGSCPLLQSKDGRKFRSVKDKIDLYTIGKEYGVVGIEEACYKSMIESLTPDNFVQVAIFSAVYEIQGRPVFAEDFDQLKRYFLDNMETIKKLVSFREASELYGGYFVDLVLGPPSAKPRKTETENVACIVNPRFIKSLQIK